MEEKWIDWYLYKPETIGGVKYGANKNKCRASVSHAWIWSQTQCSRNPKETIEGYGFCTQHAKMLKIQLRKRNPNPTPS